MFNNRFVVKDNIKKFSCKIILLDLTYKNVLNLYFNHETLSHRK